MQRFVIPLLLLAALVAAGCSSNNKKNNTATTNAGTLVPRVASPTAPTVLTPVAVNGTPIAHTATPVGPTPFAAAVATSTSTAQPSGSATAAVSATTAATTTAPPSAAAPNASATSSSAASAAATSAPASSATSASGGPSDPRALIDAIKPADSDLPSGFSTGQFSGYQANDQAIMGYANPQDVLNLLNSTGRQDGFVEQINGPNGSFGVSIQVWQDASGAKSFMDQHPVPDNTVQFQQVQLDQPLGDGYQALKIGSGAATTYALSWRVGRVVLGIGGAAGSDGKPSAAMLQLADLLTKRAQAAQQ